MSDGTKTFITESLEGLDRMERCVSRLGVRPADDESVAEIFRAVHTIKGAAGFLGMVRLEKLSHAGESLLAALREGRIKTSQRLTGGLFALADGLREIVVLIDRTGTEGLRKTDEDSQLIRELKVLNTWAGGDAVFAAQEALPEAADEKTVRVEVRLVEHLTRLVEELGVAQDQMLGWDTSARFGEAAGRLNQVTAALEGAVMAVRMQPLRTVFRRFPRMTRELARTCGKMVRMEVSGLETEVDRVLLEAMRDPLTHAVRNAVGHGIEAPEARVRAGKAEEGVIRLRAFREGDGVVIELADDGRGIDVQTVRRRAVSLGLVTKAAAAGMSEQEALQMVFLPGFTTAKEVTHLSGRGVGLDVVRANLQEVGGTVEMQSWKGQGAMLRMWIPSVEVKATARGEERVELGEIVCVR